MTRFALRCTVALLAGLVAWPLRAADLPPKFDTPSDLRNFVCIIGGFPCSGEAPVTPTMILEKALMMTMDRIRDWMIESDRTTKALQDDVKALQKDVADLKAGRQQPGGGTSAGRRRADRRAGSPRGQAGSGSERRASPLPGAGCVRSGADAGR